MKIYLLAIFFGITLLSTGCSGASTTSSVVKVAGSGDEILLNPTRSESSPTHVLIPVDPASAELELQHMLPENVSDMFRSAYHYAQVSKHPSDHETWAYMFDKLTEELSAKTSTPENAIINFSDSLVIMWNLKGDNALTAYFHNCALRDPQSMVTVLLESYGAYLNGANVNTSEFCVIEVKEQKSQK